MKMNNPIKLLISALLAILIMANFADAKAQIAPGNYKRTTTDEITGKKANRLYMFTSSDGQGISVVQEEGALGYVGLALPYAASTVFIPYLGTAQSIEVRAELNDGGVFVGRMVARFTNYPDKGIITDTDAATLIGLLSSSKKVVIRVRLCNGDSTVFKFNSVSGNFFKDAKAIK
jgi:hypothetical protein